MDQADNLCSAGHANPPGVGFCTECGVAMAPGDVAPASGESEGESPTKGGVPRRLLQVIVAAAIALVLVATSAFFLLTASVPDVLSTPVASAQQSLTDAGFTLGDSTKEFSDSVPRGSVLAQDPGAGSRARKGQQVALVVSRGPAVQVPDLSGQVLGKANSTLADLSLRVESTTEISETVPKGSIISQDPAGGTKVEQDSSVFLVVSSGPPVTTVTVNVDVSDLSLTWDSASCNLVVLLWQVTYNDSTIVGSNGQRLSSISGRWQADSDNGYYFPCAVTATFPDTPTNESRYKVNLSADGSDDSPWWTQAEMEDNDWTMQFR